MSGLLGLDWGTSSLRAYWLDGKGAICETRTRPWGVRQLPDGGFDAALADITHGWPSLPRLACGMVGSRNGWLEAPYLKLPADTAQLAATLVSVRAADGAEVHIVPGLREPRGPDVMRGEETQLVGALALRPTLARQSTWLLPGTHCKWVNVSDGGVTDFCTLMTGELYTLLLQHSILGAVIGDAVADEAAFARGVIAARDSGAAGAFSRLFSARALMLDGALAASSVPDYGPVQVIGDAALCTRYRTAAHHFGISVVEPLADAAAHGLWQIACSRGLVGSGSTTRRAPSC